MKLIRQQITRLGIQQLLYNEKEDQYYVSIKNRTYESTQPIPKDKAEIWKTLLT